MDIKSTFIRGKMNKSVDERLVPPGEYVNAINVRLGSTEISEIGAVENSKGNTELTPTLLANRVPLSVDAVCLGSYADSSNETIYWFVHDNNFNSIGNLADVIYSYNTNNNVLKEHVVSVSPTKTKLNFNPTYLITGVSKIEDLLFFTDNYNPPRVINVTRDYITAGFTEEDISVIVKPPGYANNQLPAPNVLLFNSSLTEENYLTDTFLSFAYRYKYQDNQYSAVSLFSDTAFEAKDFDLDYASRENLGMQNKFNAVDVQVSTGEKRVVGFDILFKASNSNVIYVIEKIDKKTRGIQDNTLFTYSLTSQKIYSTLGSDELLRQYDNVPLIAQAQVIQGNRLMYGNYEDGRDINLISGEPIDITYNPNIVSKEVSVTNITAPTQSSNTSFTTWSINPGNPFSASAAQVTFKFLEEDGSPSFPNGVPINTVFDLSVAVRGFVSTADNPVNPPVDFPTGYVPFQGSTLTIPVQWITATDYGSVTDMLNGDEFRSAIGTISSIQPIATSENGRSLTDRFNTLIKNGPPSQALGYINNYTLNLSSVSSSINNEPFSLLTNIANQFTISTTAVRFLNDDPLSSDNVFSYCRVIAESSSMSYGATENSRSLHSNRDYDIGLVYMDEYGRSTSALTSLNSSVHIPARVSENKNTCTVDLFNAPPPWAKKYKFVIKPNASDYNTLFVTRYYPDRQKPDVIWFKAEGDQKNIISEGMKLIVKADNRGPLNDLAIETILEIKSYGADELGPQNTESLAGLYFSIQANNIDITSSQGTTAPSFMYGTRFAETEVEECDVQTIGRTVQFPTIDIDSNTNTSNWANYSIPGGTVIRINLSIKRPARTSSVQSVDWGWNAKYVSPANYNSFKDWFEGEEIYNLIQGTKNSGLIKPVGTWAPTALTFNQTIEDDAPYYGCNTYTIGFKEVVSSGSNLYWMYISHGVPRQGPGYKKSKTTVSIRVRVQRENDLIVFETEPSPADPNLYFDSSESYDIAVNSNNNLVHKGNIQDQILLSQTPAKIELPFFNCYTFGNGVESIKILDISTEVSINLGERTTAVANEIIKRAHRFASITYSGIYSGANNLNNTNEFNLGLVNYQDYENSFGSIMKLHERETDILVLQEDKISYVLTSKNLISDSTGGGAIASVPQVLGTQIARIEEFGISSNPESFSAYGKDMFFSDVKRNAVIKLSGGSIKTDSLEVVSEYGMRSYFRDSFINNTKTQKLGGYDPYMGEYVFSNTNNVLPQKEILIPCGTEISKNNSLQTLTFNYELNTVVSSVGVEVIINNNSSDITLTAEWNGVSVINSTTHPASENIISTPSLPFTFEKTAPYPIIVKVTIVTNTASSYSLKVSCPEQVFSYVTRIILSTNLNVGKTLHTGYQYQDTVSSPPFNSPLDLQAVTLTEVNTYDGASWIDSQFGIQSLASIPYNGVNNIATVDKLYGDTFDFNVNENKIYIFEDQSLFPIFNLNSFVTAGGVSILNTETPLLITNPQTNLFRAVDVNLQGYGQFKNLLVVVDLRDFTKAATFVGVVGFPSNCGQYNNIQQYVFEANSDPVNSQFAACNLDLVGLPPGQIRKDFAHRGANSGTPRLGDPCQVSSGSNVKMSPGWYKISGNRVIQIGSGTQRGIVINKINC